MKITIILSFALVALNSGCMETISGPFDAVLKNSINQEILFLQDDKVLNSSGQTLGYFDGSNLKNSIGQHIATVNNGQILNLQNQTLGSIRQDELLNNNGQRIMTVSGTSLENKAKVSSYFFFMSF